jgi:hypothetical protein
MGEKKGSTVKIQYPFNSAACLEVQLPNGNWYRVTPNEFRSYNLPRRTSQVIKGEYLTEVYDGPTYLYGTNTIADLEKKGLIFPNDVDPRQITEKRSYGRI